MTRYSNSLEGGTNGTTITVANSGGASGNAFTAVTAGTLTFSNSSSCVAHGSLGMLTTSTAAAAYVRNAISATSFAARIYAIFPPTIGAVDEYVIRFQVSGTRVLSIHINTAAKPRILNGAGTNVWTGTNAVTSATLYRFELRGIVGTTTSNGTIEGAYYLGDSTTPVESYLASGTANVGTVAITDVLMGKYSSNAYQLGFDDPSWDDAATALIGPVVTSVDGTMAAVPLAATAAMPSPQIEGQVTVSGGGPMVGTATMLPASFAGTRDGVLLAVPMAASATAPAPSLAGTRSGTLAAVALTGSAALPAPSVAGTRSGTLLATPMAGGASLPAAGFSTGSSGTLTATPLAASGQMGAAAFSATRSGVLAAVPMVGSAQALTGVTAAQQAAALQAVAAMATGSLLAAALRGTISGTLRAVPMGAEGMLAAAVLASPQISVNGASLGRARGQSHIATPRGRRNIATV